MLKLQFIAMSCVGLLAAVVTTGCPAPVCPNCIVHSARFTVPRSPADAEIDKVLMHASAQFTGHCAGERDDDGCSKTEDKDLGVLGEGPQTTSMPWMSDDDDTLAAQIEVKYRSRSGGSAPPPAVFDATIEP